MPPFGGETVRGFDTSPQAVARHSSFFAGGDAAVELQQSYVSGDLAVLVLVERQHGEVGGLPDQEWSLRLTLVFRRTAAGWQMVHRHADLLVHPVSFEHGAQLARGTIEPAVTWAWGIHRRQPVLHLVAQPGIVPVIDQ